MNKSDTANFEATEVVGIFDREQDLEVAIDALLGANFNRADLSLLASASAVTERLGYADWQVRQLEDDPRAPTVAYASGESRGDGEGAVLGVPMYVIGVTAAGLTAAAGGPLASAIAATAVGMGAGAALGGVLAHLIGQRHVEHIETQIGHGGLLLWVRLQDAAHEARAIDILKANGARDVHVHSVPAEAEALASPEAVLSSDRLSEADKISLLRQWDYDIRELLVAEDEGMGDCQGEMLRRVTDALIALDAGPDPERSAPTKQGGA